MSIKTSFLFFLMFTGAISYYYYQQTSSNFIKKYQKLAELIKVSNYYEQKIKNDLNLSRLIIDSFRERQHAIKQTVKSTTMDRLHSVLSYQHKNLFQKINDTSKNIPIEDLGLLYTVTHRFLDFVKELQKQEKFIEAFITLDMVYLIADAANKVGSELYTESTGKIFKQVTNLYSQLPRAIRTTCAGSLIPLPIPLDLRIEAMGRGAERAIKDEVIEAIEKSKDIKINKNLVDSIAHLIRKLSSYIKHCTFENIENELQYKILKQKK